MKTTLFVQDTNNDAESLEQLLPSTRYVGSKRKLVGWIWSHINSLKFETYLDVFGGTGSLAYYAKIQRKEVTYNDLLKFNYYSGLAIIENSKKILTSEDINSIVKVRNDVPYPSFIERNFDKLYFTRKENRWLDKVITNTRFLQDRYKFAIAFHAISQACIIKRPYNLFHRANLYMRFADVKRSFGNIYSWNSNFEDRFRRFAEETNKHVFSNGKMNRALNMDALDIPGDYDLVYIDSPYMSPKRGGIDYRGYYHFLEGLSRYDEWHSMIDYDSKIKGLKPNYSIWIDRSRIETAFDYLFDRFKNSTLVVSYKTGGIPSMITLKKLLRKYKSKVTLHKRHCKYALAKKSCWELLFIAS